MRSRLGIRSAYTLLYGVRRPEDLVARAASYGASAIAVTDRDNLYGVHDVLDSAKSAGLRPIVGAELSAAPGSVFAFVKDRTGYGRLCEILSSAKRQGGFDLISALRADCRGLILASSSSGPLAGLAGRVPELYAALAPSDLSSVPTARKFGLPLVALDDATFLDTDDRAVHEVLRSIALGKTVGSLGDRDCARPGTEVLLPTEEFERRLSAWPEALNAADSIARSCTFDTIFGGFVFPGYGDGGEDPSEALRRRVIEGAERRYGELSDAVLGRIEYELDIIVRKGFAPYFLVMDDIVSMASRTCGRGSGAASIVSYALDITNVDPIEHRLYFERFLNMARPDPPDIDVDFAWDERDELIRKVIDRFGADRCARVANHATFRPRSALRETAKAYGLSDAEISRAERSLFDLDDGLTLVDPLWTEILAIAGRIEGLPRGLSMHCGGLVIAPGPISRYAPVETSAGGFPLLAWEKEGTEAAGLVKIDLLGNRSLAVIRDALANLEAQGIRIDPALWRPAEDQGTIDALARGDSLGVFYIESPAMRQLQKKTGKGDFAHIVIHSSMIRPAANKFISEYVRRLKGGLWEPLHPRLASILNETYGILCYQEDVSKTAVALAGFDEVAADALRKVIAKKGGSSFGAKGVAKLAGYRERFVAGCRENGVDGETIEKVWAMMLSFDGYSFCKPHSASYAMVSFQSAYLRVHHPAAFMAAVLSNQGGYYRPHAYVSEARRMGLSVVGPDINRSDYRYRGEGKVLVVGLMAIGNLSRAGAEGLLLERKRGGPFGGIPDLVRRMRMGRDDIAALAAAGAFDSIAGSLDRAAQARSLILGSSGAGPAPACRQTMLFDEDAPPRTPFGKSRDAVPPYRRAATTERELREEYRALGFLRDRHPLALWADEIASLRRDVARDLQGSIGRRVRLVGWPITQKTVWTVDGLAMNFVSFEDETALYETVLFPAIYERYRTLLFDQRPLIVSGRVSDDQGAISLEVETVRSLTADHWP